VSHSTYHIDSALGNGITQERVDINVMTVAEHWLDSAHREVVYQARFIDRVPYKVREAYIGDVI
jgi:hypothetical protein